MDLPALENGLLNPIAYVLAKCTGFLAYSVDGPPKCRQLRLNKCYAIVTSAFQILAGVFMVLWLFDSVTIYKVPSLLLYLLYLLGLALKYSHYFIFLIAKHAFSKQTIQIFSNLDALDKEFNRLGLKLPYVRLRILCLLSLSISLIADGYNNLIITVYTLRNPHVHLAQLVGNLYGAYTSFSETIFSLMFFSTVLIIKDMFRNLNEFLIKNFLDCNDKLVVAPSRGPVHIKNVMKHYHQLTNILRKYNRIVSPQLLLVIGNQFCYVTLQVFLFVQELAAGRIDLMFALGITAVTCTSMAKIAMLVGVSNDCQKEVGLYLPCNI
ncbi:hypothetical protein Trydic_g6290 [Trypoxylus dichotomus]